MAPTAPERASTARKQVLCLVVCVALKGRGRRAGGVGGGGRRPTGPTGQDHQRPGQRAHQQPAGRSLGWALEGDKKSPAKMPAPPRRGNSRPQAKQTRSGAETTNNAPQQPLRAAATCAKASRQISRSTGAHEARGATRNFRTEVGSSTRRHPVARR
jgi:hypothetical protein